MIPVYQTTLPQILFRFMNRHGEDRHATLTEDLSCFEYVDVYGKKKSCFQCLCSCAAVDNACEKAVSCDYSTLSLDSGNYSDQS